MSREAELPYTSPDVSAELIADESAWLKHEAAREDAHLRLEALREATKAHTAQLEYGNAVSLTVTSRAETYYKFLTGKQDA